MKNVLLYRLSSLIIALLLLQNVSAQTPVLTSFYPTTAGPGDTVFLIGSNFSQTDEVNIGSGPANTYFVSSTEIFVILGTNSSGVVYVSGSTGNSDTLSGFTATYFPAITSVSPLTAGTGDTVTIIGSRLVICSQPPYCPPTVTFGGVAATYVQAINSHLIKAVVGTGASGNIQLSVALSSTTYPGFVFESNCIPTSSTLDTTICSLFLPYRWNGKTLNTAGIYRDTLKTYTGCDSVATLNLAVKASSVSTTAITICPSQLPYIWNGQFYHTSGVYKDTLVNYVGCDSIATLILSVSLPPTPITDTLIFYSQNQTAISLSATANNGNSLLWYTTATGGSANPIAPVPSTALVANSNYYVSQTSGSCEGPRAKVVVIVSGYNIPVQTCSSVDNSAIFVSNIKGASYQWQFRDTTAFPGGRIWNNLSNNSSTTGVLTDTLRLTNIPTSLAGYQYICAVNNVQAVGNVYILRVGNTWTGATNTAWETPTNWSCGALPDSNADVIINSGTVVLSSNATVRSLTISPGASFTITAPFKLTVTH